MRMLTQEPVWKSAEHAWYCQVRFLHRACAPHRIIQGESTVSLPGTVCSEEFQG